jgi:hypothetical protein
MQGRLIKTAALILFALPVMAGLAISDLHYLGDKPNWNGFDQIRVKGYLLAGSIVGMAMPPIGPLSFFREFAPHGYHFATKSLPDKSSMQQFRNVLVTDKFCSELTSFAQANDGLAASTNRRWATKNIVHRVYFGQGSMRLFDDWAVLLAGTFNGNDAQLSYFVWGMGIVPDDRAPEFFGKQLGELSFLFPLNWSNRLEEYGLAKGYWVLLTESEATSGFSYEARKLNSKQRKRQFVLETKQLHATNNGKSLDDICVGEL